MSSYTIATQQTVSDKKNLQNTLEMKQNAFQSQHVLLFLKKIA